MGQTKAVGPAADTSPDESAGACAPARHASAAKAPHNPTASRSAVVVRLDVLTGMNPDQSSHAPQFGLQVDSSPIQPMVASPRASQNSTPSPSYLTPDAALTWNAWRVTPPRSSTASAGWVSYNVTRSTSGTAPVRVQVQVAGPLDRTGERQAPGWVSCVPAGSNS